jgi:hypothetical protein
MKTMQEQWREYRDKVYRPDMPASQNKELHQALFAGALCTLTTFTEIALLNDPEGVKALAALRKEISEICKARANELMATLN